jgi:integrase
MRIFKPSVKEYESETYPYVIETRVNGKRQRHFFKTKTAANQELSRIKTKIQREGEDALAIPDLLRITALEGQKKLSQYGKTVDDAIVFYLKHLSDSEKSITVEKLVAEFMGDQVRRQHSAIHQRDLKGRLGRFCETFGQHKVRCVTTKEIQDWLDGLNGLTPQTVNNYRDRLSFLFNFAKSHGYAESNPVEPIKPIKFAGERIEIFSVDDIQSLLNAAPYELVPILAIGAFAGVRHAEMLRLQWSDLDIKRGLLTVEKNQAKTQRRRVIVMEPALRSWLAPYIAQVGPIWSSHKRLNYVALRLARSLGIEWKCNGLRHSFASFHYAKYRSADRTAADMGNSPTVIFKNYRELVVPEEAERFFNIFPPVEAQNVIPMAG